MSLNDTNDVFLNLLLSQPPAGPHTQRECSRNICLTEPILAVIGWHSILGLIKILHGICCDLVPNFKKNILTLVLVRAL